MPAKQVLLLVVLATLGDATTLRSAAAIRGIFIGGATNAGALTNTSEPLYKATEQSQLSITTAENSCKVGPIHPEPNRYNWAGCDTVFNDARAANQSVRGHNLCWHQQNPAWLNSSLSHDELVGALESHIATVMGRYKGRAYAWDVVNEAVSDGGAGQPVVKTDYKPWIPKVPDFIDRAFTAARKADPSAKLFYNDYGAETLGDKADRMLSLVSGMQKRGIPIDGVGFQTHISNSFLGSIPSMKTNLERFAALDLEIHITELDVRACDKNSNCDHAALETQAKVYAGLLQMCLDIPKCKSFEMWGFTDKHTWIYDFNNPTHKNEMPLPWDTEYKTKPCYDAMMAVLTGAPPPPTPPPPPPGQYVQQTTTCKDAVPISSNIAVTSVADCEEHCDANPQCVGVDTDGASCYLKSKCGGVAGACAGWCSYVKK